MSTLLDDETVVLDALDHQVPCERGSDHAAALFLACRTCHEGTFLCREHYERARKYLEEMVASNRLVLGCAACNTRADSFDELVKVVPM